ncbi:MAG: hypothetical protein NVS3B25_30990 [Hymenobacter sp.]
MTISNKTENWLREASRGEMLDQLYSLGMTESSNGKGENGESLGVIYIDEMSDDMLYDKLVEYYELYPDETPVVRWDDNGGYL